MRLCVGTSETQAINNIKGARHIVMDLHYSFFISGNFFFRDFAENGLRPGWLKEEG